MYQRILLASDASEEGLRALREGALLAAACKASVFLLVIDIQTTGATMANGIYPVQYSNDCTQLLERGLSRLARLGVSATGQVQAGDPADIIAREERRFHADLIVVGHRRQGLLDRWWSGPSGAYLVDRVDCSVLIARHRITDAEFETHLAAKADAGAEPA